MNRKIKWAVILAGLSVLGILMFQYVWIINMYRVKKQEFCVKITEAFYKAVDYEMLNNLKPLLSGTICSVNYTKMEVILKKDGEELIRKRCRTNEELEHLSRSVFYDLGGLNMERLDSAYTAKLIFLGIPVRHVVELIEIKTDKIKEVSTVDNHLAKRGVLLTEPYYLGIQGKDGARVRFENPFLIVLDNMKFILVASAVLTLILIGALLFLLKLVFYQYRISRIREDFINTTVHELRNPLGFVRMAIADMRERKFSGKEALEIGEKLDKRIKSFGRTIETLQTVGKENKELNLSRIEFDPREDIEDLIWECCYAPAEESRKPHVETDMESMPRTIYADRTHYINAVGNLLGNAVKYSPGIPQIRVRCYEAGNMFCISVKDNGIGIPKTKKNRIFERYYRVKDKRTPEALGYGLGLSYVKLVAETHGGTVEVISEKGAGSEFILSIPKTDQL